MQGEVAEDHFNLETTMQPTETNCTNVESLRSLTKDDLYVVSDPALMRGVDYRAANGTMGISLLIMSGFDSDRAYIQALGRVGRFGELYKRFIWDGLEQTVDINAKIAKLSKLRNLTVKRPVVHKSKPEKFQKGG